MDLFLVSVPYGTEDVVEAGSVEEALLVFALKHPGNAGVRCRVYTNPTFCSGVRGSLSPCDLCIRLECESANYPYSMLDCDGTYIEEVPHG